MPFLVTLQDGFKAKQKERWDMEGSGYVWKAARVFLFIS